MQHTSPAPPPESPRVSWSPEAIRELELTVKDRSVQEDLKRNAEETLHETQERSDENRQDHSADEGRAWRDHVARGWSTAGTPGQVGAGRPRDDGPWNYVLFYRKASGPAVFEVLAVRSYVQIANCWNQMNDDEAQGRGR